MSAGQPIPPAGAEARGLRGRVGLGPATRIFLWSRLAIWAAAVFVASVFTPSPDRGVDVPALTHDLGEITNVWARWDSVWFLRIAKDGYHAAELGAASFYPLYPALVGGLGRILGGSYVLAGIAVSFAASWVAFLLLYRTAGLRLGSRGARRAVLYLAVFPMVVFLQAVYSEALFLAFSLGAFFLAERNRWLPAWLAASLAVLTRSIGIALLPSLVLLAWRAPERRRAVTGLAIPVGLYALYPLILWRQTGDALAMLHTEERWQRHVSPAGPLGGIWDGLRAGWAGIEQLASGSEAHRYWATVTDSRPLHAAFFNLETLAYLALFVGLTVIVWRRFGAPYGLYCTLSLAIPLSAPSDEWPLLSIPRFGLVVFPFFLALASLGASRRVHVVILSVSIALLSISIVQWSLWRFVA